jgi:outer membrane immunogenic protein
MSKTSFVSVSVAALLISLTAAKAADLPTVAPQDAIVSASVYDWTGFYIGAQVGYAGGDADRVNTAGFANDFNIDGVVGGIHAGYNHQVNNWVFGVEADIELSGIKGDDAGVGGAVDTLEAEWLGSVRARIGYAFDRTLVYATGGVAFAGVDANANNGAASISDDNTHIGWTVGAGVEHAFTNNITARIEYRYTDFSDKSYALGPAFADANYELDSHAVRVGVSYKF